MQDCKTIFRDIHRGFSFNPEAGLYIKHVSFFESIEHEEAVASCKNEVLGQLPSEAEKLEILNKTLDWTTENEDEYQEQSAKILDLKKDVNKLIIPSQKKQAQEILKVEEDKLRDLSHRRRLKVGMTLEGFEAQKSLEKYIATMLFNDKEFKTPLFDIKSFDDLEYEELLTYFDIYSDFLMMFNEKNFKKIAAAPGVLDLYLLSVSPEDFFGAPLPTLTLNQITLAYKFRYYKSLRDCSELREVPYDEQDPEKIVYFYDQEYSVLSSKNKK